MKDAKEVVIMGVDEKLDKAPNFFGCLFCFLFRFVCRLRCCELFRVFVVQMVEFTSASGLFEPSASTFAFFAILLKHLFRRSNVFSLLGRKRCSRSSFSFSQLLPVELAAHASQHGAILAYLNRRPFGPGSIRVDGDPFSIDKLFAGYNRAPRFINQQSGVECLV